ncbi:hypothetical protein [Streptomyces sp. NPDC002994]|uniref:hypothetical protein n=1 Tax=Streptomyces sp. NPDC002994 TaxID=3154441 RepID=UPI0033B71B65
MLHYADLVGRVVGDGGPMAPPALHPVPGPRMLYDTSDAVNPQAEVVIRVG